MWSAKLCGRHAVGPRAPADERFVCVLLLAAACSEEGAGGHGTLATVDVVAKDATHVAALAAAIRELLAFKDFADELNALLPESFLGSFAAVHKVRAGGLCVAGRGRAQAARRGCRGYPLSCC